MAFLIAVDGPAASGKGVISRRLGEAFGLRVLDTGLLYRAVGAAVIGSDGDLADAAAAARAAGALDLRRLNADALRSGAAGEAASRVAIHPEVRLALLELQRAFAAPEPGAVLDGRDIGTVVLPAAQVKFYVTAGAEARARRRWLQLRADDPGLSLADTLADIH
ncbi:MAG: (d)CMP kinase, partial [Caulobacteraceae bacterium]